MLIPLTHENMSVQRLPWITIGIIALNVLVFVATLPRVMFEDEERYALLETPISTEADKAELIERWRELQAQSLFGQYGFVPAHQDWAALASSMFLHAGLMHLLGNMYLLWLSGCNIEDVWGRPLYAALYIASGVIAAFSHVLAFPSSEAPLVGASGAIAGMMGAFLVRLYRTRIRFFYIIMLRWGTFMAPAWLMLPLWLGEQVFSATFYSNEIPVAFWAHVGGFLFGTAAAAVIKVTRIEEAFLAPAIEQKVTLFAQSPRVASALEKMESGRHQEAVRELRVAVTEGPDDVDAWDLLGQCYLSLGNGRAAAEAYIRKIRVHLKRREPDLAVTAYQSAIEADPGAPVAPRELLALAGVMAESQRWDDALPLYEKARAAPEPIFQLKACLALADFYIQDNRRERALNVLSGLPALADSHPEWKTAVEARLARAARLKRFAPVSE